MRPGTKRTGSPTGSPGAKRRRRAILTPRSAALRNPETPHMAPDAATTNDSNDCDDRPPLRRRRVHASDRLHPYTYADSDVAYRKPSSTGPFAHRDYQARMRVPVPKASAMPSSDVPERDGPPPPPGIDARSSWSPSSWRRLLRQSLEAGLPEIAVLEVFAGKAVLSRALCSAGLCVLPPIEKDSSVWISEAVDILDPAVTARLRDLIQNGGGNLEHSHKSNSLLHVCFERRW